MKHILPILTAALLGVAAPVFADFNFEVQWQPYKNTQGIYDGTAGKYFIIKVTGDKDETGKIYLTNLFNNAQSSTQNEVLDGVITDDNTGISVRVTDFGYTSKNKGSDSFSMTPENIVDLSASSDDPNMKNLNKWDSINRNGFYLGEFTAGDEIEVSLTAVRVDETGKAIGEAVTVKSNDLNGQHNSNFGVKTDLVNDALLKDNKTTNELLIGSLYYMNQLNFGILGARADGTYVYGTAKDVTAGAVGSPLPGGVQIALIAGLFGLGFWYIRRRKAAVA